MSPNAGGGEGGCGVSANEYGTVVHMEPKYTLEIIYNLCTLSISQTITLILNVNLNFSCCSYLVYFANAV
jgi:hypothetical protein